LREDSERRCTREKVARKSKIAKAEV